jgi:cytochrome c-type biogenesis protein CcmH
MLFWITCALMTFAAVAAMLYPYLGRAMAQAEATDLEVYKDQLKEIDADEKRGLVSGPEATTARIEVSRRILQADETLTATQAAGDGRIAKALLVCAALGVPIFSWGLYATIGSPELPDQPIAARLNVQPADASLDVLVAKAEEHLVANPKDGRGWSVIAPIYLRQSRFEDAIKAYQMAAELNGPKAAYEIGIGQSWTGLNGGRANDQARAAFQRATKIEPANPEPKILLGVDLAQQGKLAEAKTAFEAILASAPADAPWRSVVADLIAKVDSTSGASTPSDVTPGPTQSDIDQAANMSSDERAAMIEGMIAQLDAKLVDNPLDADGWKRLMRSYVVLNKADKALETLNRAKIGLKENPQALAEINALSIELGIAKP